MREEWRRNEKGEKKEGKRREKSRKEKGEEGRGDRKDTSGKKFKKREEWVEQRGGIEL